MDPHKPPPILTNPLKRKARSPSPEQRSPHLSPGASGSQHSPTALPSIRQLHPFLPPPGPLRSPHTAESHYQYPPPAPPFPVASGSNVRFAHVEAVGPSDFSPSMGDSEPDGDPEPLDANRPKQKRRRQALSCTECKRRKIKCDRAHPCGPCSRRGDQSKCQWHVIEPVDKYVSRAEFDELKARCDRLEAIVGRMQSPFQAGPSRAPDVHAAAVSSGMPAAPGSAPHPPPPPFRQPTSRQGARRDSFVSMHPGPEQPRPALPSMQAPSHPQPAGHPAEPYQPPPGMTARPSSSSRASGMPRSPPPPGGAKPSPLSLSAITTPYNVTPQSKNSGAQTFTPLGERLRPRVSPEGPAATSPRHRTRTTLRRAGARPSRLQRAKATLPWIARRLGIAVRLHNPRDAMALVPFPHDLVVAATDVRVSA
ncbi:hypothetical protein DENSPDRAFT_431224 [Dentipellis sp. KUC8613]|nr:hypothetical protein DENSPDRAFT_431224 [Dentipellis sp. KUC8613]